jgi:hypothetical protein
MVREAMKIAYVTPRGPRAANSRGWPDVRTMPTANASKRVSDSWGDSCEDGSAESRTPTSHKPNAMGEGVYLWRLARAIRCASRGEDWGESPGV